MLIGRWRGDHWWWQMGLLPCALLVAGSCSIYAGRPEACRSHHTSDAAVCEANMADPAVNLSKVYIPALRARMFAVEPRRPRRGLFVNRR